MDKKLLDKIIKVFKITCVLYDEFKQQNEQYTKYKRMHRTPVHSIDKKKFGSI